MFQWASILCHQFTDSERSEDLVIPNEVRYLYSRHKTFRQFRGAERVPSLRSG